MKLIKYIFLTVLILAQFSCTKEKDSLLHGGEGYLRFGFEQEEDILMTRAAGETIFSVKVIDKVTGVIVKSVEDHRDLLDAPLKLRSGDYKVLATTGEDVDAAFDNPFYIGEKEVTVTEGATTEVHIVCSLANVKVSVLIDETVFRNFTKSTVTVDNADKGVLIFDKEKSTLTKYGYFKCTGTLNWVIDLVNNNGTSFQYKDQIKDVKARQHYRLKFSIDEDGDKETGGASLNITIDETTNDIDHHLDVSLTKKPAPTVVGKDFDYESSLMSQIGTNGFGQLRFSAQAGLNFILLKHNSPELLALGIPEQFNVADIQEIDRNIIANAGIEWDDFQVGMNALDMDFRKLLPKLPLGQFQFFISIKDNQLQYVNSTFNIIITPDVEITTLGAEPWAKFATIRGQWNTLNMPEGMGFKYKEDGATDWITVTDGIRVGQDKEFYLKLTGLKPNTRYLYKSISAKDESNVMSFTTELDAQLPNMSFDTWIKQGREWYPNTDLGDGFFWDTANTGANTLSEVNPTRPEDNDVAVPGPGKRAAKLVSSSVLGVMAAGNIYSGKFIERQGTSAIIDWGRPFVSRPVSLKGYFKYQPKTIDKVKPPYEHLMGTTDNCQIFVALMDWEVPYRINSAKGNYINFDTDPNVIAYGQMTSDEYMSEYREFDIEIKYRDNRKPKYVVMVCVASKYGDYFTGGIGSTLLVDELEFIY